MPEENASEILTESPDVDDVSKAAIDLAKIRESAETARSAAKEATESRSAAASALSEAQAKLAEINVAGRQTVAAMTKVMDGQAVIATKSDHIENAQIHADKVRANLDRVLTSATQHATEAEGHKTRAQTVADSTTELQTQVRAAKGTVDADAEAITAARNLAEESARQTKGLAEKSTAIEVQLAAYETQLAELKTRSANQLKTIESLLPGAASAGLAHAFDARRQTFLQPQRKWENWFISSVAAVVLLAGVSLLQIYLRDKTPSLDEVLLLWLSRLPVAGGLVWLALHASREAALAKRLEEDYGYKSAIASTFLGFHKQMSEIGTAANTNTPLGTLCADTLATIASPPGRIYDKHELTVSPTKEIKDVVEVVNPR